MPGAIAKAGLADAIVPIDVVAPEISRRIATSARASTSRIQVANKV
jgi:hypothetical protein